MRTQMRVNKIPETLKLINMSLLIPLHEPTDYGQVNDLVEDFTSKGWFGRPLLVVFNGKKKYRCLTGSHRFAAAKKAGLKRIPCMVIEGKLPKNLLREFDRDPRYDTYSGFGRD